MERITELLLWRDTEAERSQSAEENSVVPPGPPPPARVSPFRQRTKAGSDQGGESHHSQALQKCLTTRFKEENTERTGKREESRTNQFVDLWMALKQC